MVPELLPMSLPWDEFLHEFFPTISHETHCCECERGIRHIVCVEYPTCQATASENCNYRWAGEEAIVVDITPDKQHIRIKTMDFQAWEIYRTQGGKIIKLGDYGLAEF